MGFGKKNNIFLFMGLFGAPKQLHSRSWKRTIGEGTTFDREWSLSQTKWYSQAGK